ncbi:hypothetical protein LR48_Vigan10g179400 [Vigna angularis]|uniref:Uncharacterized protein n=1 Tax=Phaseolus angularis TaxID=3914 RepID=A0A0L9VLX4_PHAAN|nr:hypothetical protein LR48_Vigan10g179400 [Vigna angularis]
MERPRKEIDSSCYNQYCMLDEAAQPVPPPHPPRVHRRGPLPAHAQPQDAEPFQMRDMYMSLMESRIQALHRGQAQASGVGAAEASAMEDDEEEADEEEEDDDEEED